MSNDCFSLFDAAKVVNKTEIPKQARMSFYFCGKYAGLPSMLSTPLPRSSCPMILHA